MAAKTKSAVLASSLRELAAASHGTRKVSYTVALTCDGDVHVYSVYFPHAVRARSYHSLELAWQDFLAALIYQVKMVPDVTVHVEIPNYLARNLKSSLGIFRRNSDRATSTGTKITVNSNRRFYPVFSSKELTLNGEASKTQPVEEIVSGKDRAYID